MAVSISQMVSIIFRSIIFGGFVGDGIRSDVSVAGGARGHVRWYAFGSLRFLE